MSFSVSLARCSNAQANMSNTYAIRLETGDLGWRTRVTADGTSVDDTALDQSPAIL